MNKAILGLSPVTFAMFLVTGTQANRLKIIVVKLVYRNDTSDWDELLKIRKEYNEFITASAEVMNRLQSFMAVSEETKSNRKNK